MKRIGSYLLISCFVFFLISGSCFAQIYTITNLGTSSSPKAINSTGEVTGNVNGHAFLWSSSSDLQDLGTLVGGTFSGATAINDLGHVSGTADGPATTFDEWGNEVQCSNFIQPFVWTQAGAMQGLGAPQSLPPYLYVYLRGCAGPYYYGTGINILDQVVGYSDLYATFQWGVVGTQADGITLFGGNWPPTYINGISNAGQIVGQNATYPKSLFLGHATSWQNGAQTDLGTLGGADDLGYPVGYSSSATGINDIGQVVGWSTTVPVYENWYGWYGQAPIHAVLWTNGAMRDLGTLSGDTFSAAAKINSYGQVVGASGNSAGPEDRYRVLGRPFIWSDSSGMTDLNNLIPFDSGWVLTSATDINASGKIVGEGTLNGQSSGFLLTPIYQAFVQQPINADGSSVFKGKRGALPVKFTLTQNNLPTCALPAATIAVTRTAGAMVGSIDVSVYSTNADDGSNFRIDPSTCQYTYNVGAAALGVGTYRADISISGIMVGHAVFGLK
ncbi:MAG TPA: hypothetical protein VFA89_21055 [Terriglobales bacterium]|nr:hypothetical protein [Terriglobales bacterium]